MDVPPTTFPALGKQDFLTMLGHIGNQLAIVLINHQRTNRHTQNDVIRALAVAVRTTTILAVLCLVDFGITEINQRVDVTVSHSPDAATFAAITTIRAAERPEFLARS